MAMGLPDEGFLGSSKLRTYCNSTLQDNWFEDRFQTAEAAAEAEATAALAAAAPAPGESGLIGMPVGFGNVSQPLASTKPKARYFAPNTFRCMATDVPVRDFTTSFQNSFKGEQLPPKKDKRVKMVQVRNFYREVTTDRAHPELPQKGFGSVLPSHPASYNKTFWDTTYKNHYEDARLAAQTQPLEPEKGDDGRFVGGYAASVNANVPERGQVFSDSTQFNYTRTLNNDVEDSTAREEAPRGSSGARGALVRVPQESGAKAGVSVYQDDYAKK